jgi:hypothetical protein
MNERRTALEPDDCLGRMQADRLDKARVRLELRFTDQEHKRARPDNRLARDQAHRVERSVSAADIQLTRQQPTQRP